MEVANVLTLVSVSTSVERKRIVLAENRATMESVVSNVTSITNVSRYEQIILLV